MKILVILSFVLASQQIANAQSDTTKIEQYCQVVANRNFFSNKVVIDIDFGEEKSLLREYWVKEYGGKVRKFNTIIDALNFMGKEGWVFINAFPVHMANTEVYHFAFKKVINKIELQKN
ncbi:hypothetical protein [Spirosoma gilvum]